MDDKTDIERALIEEKYIKDNAKFKIGDLVKSNKLRKYVTRSRIGIIINIINNLGNIYYKVDFYDYGELIVRENTLIKIGEMRKNDDSLPPIEF